MDELSTFYLKGVIVGLIVGMFLGLGFSCC